MKYINITTHNWKFVLPNGKTIVEIEPSGIAISADETGHARDLSGIKIETTIFTPSKDGLDALERIKQEMNGSPYIVFGGRIVAMTYDDIVGAKLARGFRKQEYVYDSKKFVGYERK